ncbi:MAG: hypothetical protein WC712_11850 [Candidatus Brocadiia bacterium]
MRPVTLVLIAVMLFCGCSWSVKPGQPSPNSEIEILVSAVPAIGKANDPDSDGYVSIGGKSLTWAELDAYLQARAVDTSRLSGTDGKLSTPIVIRSAPETRVVLLQFATCLCAADGFLQVFWGKIGEKARFSVGLHRLLESRWMYDMDVFVIMIMCISEEESLVWSVDNQQVTSAAQIRDRIEHVKSETIDATKFMVVVDSYPDVPFLCVFEAFEAAAATGITDVVGYPPRVPLKGFPKAVREALKRAGML